MPQSYKFYNLGRRLKQVIAPIVKLFSAILNMGVDSLDGAELRSQKRLFNGIILFFDIPTSVLQITFFFLDNQITAALLNSFWAVFDLSNLIYFGFRRHNFYSTVRRILFLGILMPLALTLPLGGIFASKGILMLTLMIPVGASIFFGKRAALQWTGLVFVVMIIGAALDPFVRPYSIILDSSTVSSFTLSMFNVGIIVGVGLYYFIKQREQALDLVRTRTEELQRKNEELNNKNKELVESREELLRSVKRTDLVFAALTDALPGTVLDDKYQLDEKIGSGGFGTVYRATHLLLQNPVAVKVFRPSFGADPMRNLERFRIEGISASRVRHPNAVHILDFGVSTASIAYMVMELLEGWSLNDELKENGILSVSRCAQILVPVCNALAEAHAAGIVHRDIKPSNIFLHQSKDGERVKVVDFGIAKLVSDTLNPELQSLTETGSLLGTPVYMSPERLSNKAYDGQTDIYSLGVMIYEMLCGRLPFESSKDNYWSIVLMHMTHTPTSPRKINREIPEKLEALMMKAMAKDPLQRPTAKELGELIKEFAGVEDNQSTPGSSRVFRKPSQPHTTIGRTRKPASQPMAQLSIEETNIDETIVLSSKAQIQENKPKGEQEKNNSDFTPLKGV